MSATQSSGDNEFEIDNDLVLDHFDTGEAPQRIQFPRIYSNFSALSNSQSVVNIHINTDVEDSSSEEESMYTPYSPTPLRTFTVHQGRALTSTSTTKSSALNTSTPTPLPTPEPATPITPVPISPMASIESTSTPELSSQPEPTLSPPSPPTRPIPHNVPLEIAIRPTTPSTETSMETEDFFPDTPRNMQHNHNSSPITLAQFDPEINHKPNKVVTYTSEEFQGLDYEDINKQLHNPYLPDWCSCGVSNYLYSSTIRSHAFQSPIDPLQICVIVVLLLSLILSILIWFLSEPNTVALATFGTFWFLLVATIILMWIFVSFIETRAYKLSNIPQNPEELYKLDKRLLDHGKAKMKEIQAKNEELERNNPNSSSFGFGSSVPGQHHELAGFVPVRQTINDYMTDLRFCCFLFRRPKVINKPNLHPALAKYHIDEDIPQQRQPFWFKPYNYYMKIFGDFQTTVQYFKQQEELERKQRQLQQQQFQDQARVSGQGPTGQMGHPSGSYPEFSRRPSNVSHGDRTPRIRAGSVAPSFNRNYTGYDSSSRTGGVDNSDTQSLVSTLSTLRRQQILISPNKFNITHPSFNDSPGVNSNHNPDRPFTPSKGNTPRSNNPLVVPGTLTNQSSLSTFRRNSTTTDLPNIDPKDTDLSPQLPSKRVHSRGRLTRKESALEPSVDHATDHQKPIEESLSFSDDDELVDDEHDENSSSIEEGLGHFHINQAQLISESSAGQRRQFDSQMSEGEDEARTSTIQPLINFGQFSAVPAPRPLSIRSHSLTPSHRSKLLYQHHAFNAGSNNSSPTADPNNLSNQTSPLSERRRVYSTLQHGDYDGHNLASTPMNASTSMNATTPMNQTTERGTLSQLKHSNSYRSTTFRFDQTTTNNGAGTPIKIASAADTTFNSNNDHNLDESMSVVTQHNVMVLRGVQESADRTNQKAPTALEILENYELPAGTGTYQYENIIIDTQQQLVPIEPTSWWPHHLLSLYELYQLTDSYFTPPREMRTEYQALISEYDSYRINTGSHHFKYQSITAAPEHAFVGIANNIRLNSRSGVHGSISGERGYHNDEVCVMLPKELRMNYFNHFHNILSLPFHIGYFGNASSPADPDIETPIPVFGLGVKESRPLQKTFAKGVTLDAPSASPIAQVQNATTIMVVDDMAHDRDTGPSFASSVSIRQDESRGRPLHHEASFNQYTFISRGQSMPGHGNSGQTRRQSLQPIAVHSRRSVYNNDSMNATDLNSASHPHQSIMLATESFIRDGSMTYNHHNPTSGKGPILQTTLAPNTTDPSTITANKTPDNLSMSQQAPTQAYTYVHPNQVAEQLHTKKLNTEGTTQQRLYINTKRGPLVCIDEPNHCQKHENARGIVVASAKCSVDIDKKPAVCKTCRIFQEPSMLHCSICNKCQENFDHHCPYLNICIGERNYHVFYTLVLCVTLFTLLNCFLSVRALLLSVNVDMFGDNEILSSSDAYYEGRLFGTAWFALLILSIVSIIINLIGIAAFGSLLSIHTYLVYARTTTRALLNRWKLEKQEKKREKEEKERVKQEAKAKRKEKKQLELARLAELSKAREGLPPHFKPTTSGISLSVTFDIDLHDDVATLDNFRTQPRRQTIYHRKASGVIDADQPMPIDFDENGRPVVELQPIAVIEEAPEEDKQTLEEQRAVKRASMFKHRR